MEGTDEIVYEGYTRNELRTAFELVENPQNWKLPINGAIAVTAKPVDDVALLKLVSASVVFYTGARPVISQDRFHKVWYVKAPGYYATVGS